MTVAIVVGAGRGMGAAVAHKLKLDGYDLALLSPSENVFDRAAELDALAVKGSNTNIEDINRLVSETIERYGRIDALVNNTGHTPGSTGGTGPAYDPSIDTNVVGISDEDWLKTFEITFMSVVKVTRAVFPEMLKGGGGSIVNISTFAAFEPRLTYPTSSAVRCSVSGYTKLFSDRYAREGIRMNSVLPGFIDNWPLGDDVYRYIPMGRPGTTDEVADLVSFLLSDSSRYITGQSMRIDGGATRFV
ncbi:MAG: SDR family oxidoreductase [Thalassospira sp.]|uniref:SDR family oxidoreductase n=1 Tax=Thalassospira sp. TaxID=1912094 RepID=UPI003A887800